MTYWGYFSPDEPDTVWLPDDDDVTLVYDFAYTDPRGKRWVAPRRSITNGASIPRVFWTIAGAPLNGRYRRAAVLHDAHCDLRIEPWRNVHRMFYEALRCCGVGWWFAWWLWAAVRFFGPRW